MTRMTTDKQIAFIEKLRSEDPIPTEGQETIQIPATAIAQIMQEETIFPLTRKMARQMRRDGADEDTIQKARDAEYQRLAAEHTIESYLPAAQAILDAEWERGVWAMTTDPAQLTVSEASELIDILKAPMSVGHWRRLFNQAGDDAFDYAHNARYQMMVTRWMDEHEN
ncbi:MAG: hypothetical protein E7J96_05680 [Actinomyces sp.]|nr:hypothetical protein [Actinomyces sp.]